MLAMALYVRPLTAAEHAAVVKARRSSNGVTSRRANVIALSEAGEKIPKIAEAVGLSVGWVRGLVHAVNREGVEPVLYPRGRRTGRPKEFDEEVARGLEELLNQPPAGYGFQTVRWTLEDLAQAAQDRGLVEQISSSSVWRLLLSRGRSWKQAKRRMTSPDPLYEEKRGCARR